MRLIKYLSYAGLIENNGNLILENIKVISADGIVSVVNKNGGNLSVKGDCTLQLE